MVAAIIQARMGSSRFSGKSARLLSGLSILEHIIIRLQQVPEINPIQLATTREKSEAPLIEIAKNRNILVFQGDEENVLETSNPSTPLLYHETMGYLVYHVSL